MLCFHYQLFPPKQRYQGFDAGYRKPATLQLLILYGPKVPFVFSLFQKIQIRAFIRQIASVFFPTMLGKKISF